MDEAKIIQYLYQQGVENPVVAGNLTAQVTKYDDIKQEFLTWLQTGTYPTDGLKVEGYSAAEIAKLAPFMNGVGVYNFLVDLRDQPATAKQAIADGFPRR